MCENTRKMLSLLMAVAMLFSMLPLSVSAQEQPELQTQPETVQPEIQPLTPVTGTVPETTVNTAVPGELTLGEKADVVITEGGQYMDFTFTPEESGLYAFYGVSNTSTKGELYNANGNLLKSNTYSGAGSNFQITMELTAGEAYTLRAKFMSSSKTGTFQVAVKLTPLASLTFAPITTIENMVGSWTYGPNPETGDYDMKYFFYYNGNLIDSTTYTATYRDGTVVTGIVSSGMVFDEVSYELQCIAPQSYDTRWQVGNTYNMDVSVLGGIIRTQVPVTIVKSPLQSFTFTPVSVVEGNSGYTNSYWDSETGSYVDYYYYNPDWLLGNSAWTATFEDGTVLTGTGVQTVTYNGVDYSMRTSCEQDGQNQWTVGNTYNVEVSLIGVTVQVPVTITPFPLVSLSFSPVTITEGTNGSWYTTETGSYFSYYPGELLQMSTYTATFVDGTVLTGEFRKDYSFTYDGQIYNISFVTDQTAENPWVAGNTYAVQVAIKNVRAQVPVTIEASPLQSITFTPVSVIENTNGYYSSYYDSETETYQDYYCYYSSDLLWKSTWTATFADGTVLTGSQTGFTYNGEYFGFNYSTNQNYQNQWTVGNTYYITVMVMGQQVQVPVTIEASALQSITFTPITVIEGTNGYNSSGYDPETGTYKNYYHYRIYDLLRKSTYTATFADGTVQTGSGTGFYYNGEYFGFGYTDGQSYQNQWTVGNTYSFDVIVLGKRVQIPVTIIPSPVESISFSPVVVEENKDGYWNYGGDTEYYYYSNWEYNVVYTVTFRDGTVLSGKYPYGVEYGGEYYSANSSRDNQSTIHWQAGNTYIAEVQFDGKWYEVPVTVARTTENNGYTYLVQDGKAIINGCTMKTEILQIPETIDGYPVVGILSLGTGLSYAKEIRIPDSVTMLSEDILTSDYGTTLPLEKLTIGSGISAISMEMLRYARLLKHIEITEGNPNLCSIDGVVYNKNVTKLMAYPPAKTELHKVPDSVTDISELFGEQSWHETWLSNLNIQFGENISDYKLVDGVIYDADMTEILRVTPVITGSYVMPDTVRGIRSFAFANSNVKAVTLAPSVTETSYNSFSGAINLEEITVPETVTFIGMMGFSGTSLKKVHITSLEAWCNIRFYENPLWVAHDLYLNGELVKDLVIPETVTDKVYNPTGLYAYAFEGGSFESVSIPSRIEEIGHGAFDECENLKKVYITDLGAWSGTLFADATANPLYYARDLYLNGELVTDLVLTETVSNRVYAGWSWPESASMFGVGDYAFINASIKSVTVPESIDYFGYRAFEGCDNLEKVNVSSIAEWSNAIFDGAEANPLSYARNLYLNGEKVTDLVIDLPELVTYGVYGKGNTIGKYAFYNSNIESLTVPGFVYNIDSYAFYGSTVEKVTFDEGIQSIGNNAFEASQVQAVDFPDSLGVISQYAFYRCKALEAVTFGNGLRSIIWCAFAESGVKSIDLPDSLTYMGSEAFENCRSLEHASFGNTLNVIPYECFRNTGLKTVTLPKQIECVESGAFSGSQLTELIIECDSVEIWESAFANCPLGDLEFGDNVTRIGAAAFIGTNAAQIKIPASVTEISYRVYAFNKNLVSVTIPGSVEYINASAFEGDKNLSHVLYTGTQEQWAALDTQSPELLNATLHCEAVGNEVTTTQTCTTITYHCSICDKTETLRKGTATHAFDENEVCTVCGYESYWEYTADMETKMVTILGYTGPDKDIQVPETIDGMPVVSIAPGAFVNNDLVSVNLPVSIKEIPTEAFTNCTTLQKVSLGTEVTKIGEKAFYGCSSLHTIYMPDTVKYIGDSAFAGCSELRNVSLPKSLTHIGKEAFAFCAYAFERLEIPEGVTEISECAFEGCYYVKELALPNTVTSIAYYAFSGTSIKELVIPASVEKIGDNAFDISSYYLKTVVFQGDKPEMRSPLGDSGVTVFYPNNKTWDSVPEDSNSWYACNVPTFTKQPVSITVDPGQIATVSAEAYGHRLSYQWYYAAPGAKRFAPVGGDSIELSMVITKENSGGRAYCIVTDIMGRTAKSETVTLKNPTNATGIRLDRLPYTLEYDLRQELRTRGLEVKLLFDDNTEESVTDYTVTGYNPNVGGKQTVTVNFGGYTATFTVTVNEEKLNFTNTEQKVEISAPEGAVDSAVELIVEKLEQDEEEIPEIPALPEIPEILQENKAVVFDISLEKGGETVQPKDTVQVSIPVPAHMESKRCKVYHIAEDGTVTDMNAFYKDGRMVFSTNHFSYYAVVEATGVTVSGTVTGSGEIIGTVVNLISSGEVLETVAVAQDGTYRFENVLNSDYEIEAVQEGMPAKKQNITVADQDMILDILLAILGDIDGSDTVTTDDVVQLLLHVSMPDIFPIDAIADFNGDGFVTTDDVVQLLLHVSMPDIFPLQVG